MTTTTEPQIERPTSNVHNVTVVGFANSPEWVGHRLANSLTAQQAEQIAAITVDTTAYCYFFWKSRPTRRDIASIKSDLCNKETREPLRVFHFKAKRSNRGYDYYTGALENVPELGVVRYA
jgi:hypothetical protein